MKKTRKQSASRERKKKGIVAVVGLGYVGLPLALLAARKGYQVIGIDRDPEKLDLIRKGKSPFADDKVERELKRVSSSLEVTDDFARVAAASIIVICVPTPVDEDRRPNLEALTSATQNIAQFLRPHQLVILESTVNPGVTEHLVLPILMQESGMIAGEDFYLAHCPERINPGDTKWNVENIPRVVGGLGDMSVRKAAAFYRSILKGKVMVMGSVQEAEAVKVVENSFRDINIAFVNELAKSFARLGIDVVKVIEGASTKPFAFMAHYPGCGVGGHCIPVDPHYLIEYAKQNGFHHEFLVLARRINSSMPEFTVKLLEEALQEKGVALQGANVALLGLAYKANIDDPRESPAFDILELLQEHGARVRVFDPFIPGRSNVKSLQEALSNADGVILATAHDAFTTLSPKDFSKHGVRVVVDGRNCFPKERFASSEVTYKGIGR